MKGSGLMDSMTGNISAIPKIKNGSKLAIGNVQTLNIFTDHHFNWFQKKMIKWCFGFTVTDYSEH